MKRLFRNKLVKRRNDGFRVEALEPRLLLSADPVLGAAQVIMLPDRHDGEQAMPAYDAGQFEGLDHPLADAPAPAPQAFLDGGAHITPADPTQAIVIGGTGGAGAMNLSAADIHAAAAGGGAVVVGGADGSHVISIGQQGAAAPVVLNNTLVLANPQQGGEIFVNSALKLQEGASLVIYGSGHTTTFGADTTTDTDILTFDSIKVHGAVTLTAGTDGSGNVQLGGTSAHTLDGDGDQDPDRLTVLAPGNVSIRGVVGGRDALQNLSVGGVTVNGVLDLPDSVTFEQQVTVNGDFQVNSSGLVTFKDTVYVNAGGNLSILHANNVVFEKGIVVSGTTLAGASGNILIEGDEISFKGGNESVFGNGELRLRPSTVGLAIELGTPVNSVSANTLNIDNGEILTFADGFSKIVVGHETGGHAAAGSGAVRVGAINQMSQPTLRDPLEVYGGSIAVEDYNTPDYTLLVNGSIKLDAVGAISIANQVEASDGGLLQDITLYSASGLVRQVDAAGDGLSGEVLRAGHLDVHAGAGINLGATEVASVSLANTGSGDIVLRETARGGDLRVDFAHQYASASAGAIDIATLAGNLTVAGQVGIDGGGAVTLGAAGSGKQLAVNQAIDSVGGAITLNSGTDIAIAANVVSHAGGAVALNAAGAIGMGATTTISSTNPLGDDGQVRLAAGSSVALAHIVADGAIAVTAGSGAVTSSAVAGVLNFDGDSAALTLSASAGLGSGTGALLSRVRTLAATNTASGGLYLREQTALSLAGTGPYAIDLGGTGGQVSITTVDGALGVDGAVRSTGSVGHVLLQSGEALEATAADLAVRAAITSSAGSISLLSADDLLLDDALDASAPRVATLAAGQTIDLAANGALRFETAAQLATNGGNVRAQSGGDATLGVIQAGAGKIAIVAGGAILDAQDDDAGTRTVNLTASAVRLEATVIGSGAAALETAAVTLAARAAAGGAWLAELDGLSLGSVAAVQVKRVGADGSTGAVADAAPLAGLAIAANGDAVLVAGGNLALDAPVSAPGSGNLRIESKGTLNVNAPVDAGSGNVSLLAAGTLAQSAAGIVKTAGGSIDVESSAGAITMADGALAQSGGGNIRYRAAGDLGIALLDARSAGGALAGQAGWGAVSVNSGGTVTATADAAPAIDVYARELRLAAKSGIAGAAATLDTETAVLSADAGSGDLFLVDATDLALAQTAALVVNRVKADGSVAASTVVDAAQANLAAGRDLVLRTVEGSLALQAGGAVSAGRNLLLQAGGRGNLVLGAAVTNSAGHTSLAAGGDLLQTADVRALGAGATVALGAGGRIAMDGNATVATNNGNVALGAGADIAVGRISAGNLGNVRVASSGGSILDAEAAGDTEADILAGALQLSAAGAIGASGNPLETAVATLAAAAGSGGAYLRESDGLAVGSVSVAVNAVGADGKATAGAATGLAGLSVGGGNLVMVSASGDLAVSQAVTAAGSGNLLLQASNGTLTLDAALSAAGGQLSVIAGNIRQNAAITTGGSVDAMAYDDLLMAAGAVTTAGASVRYAAEDMLAVGVIGSGAGASLLGSAITDAGVAGVNVTAATLRLEATGSQSAGGIGSATDRLETAAARLAARSTGAGLFLGAAGAVAIDQVDALALARVTSSGATITVGDAALSDLVSSGALVLQAVGTLTLNDGNGDGSAAGAAGNVLLQAGGAASDLVVNAAVRSTAGHLSLDAGRTLRLNADVQTQGNTRTLTLDAGADLLAAQGTAVRSANGNLALAAGGNVVIETLASGSAHTSVSAGGDIVDGDAAGDSEIDITASGLRLQAGGAIGGAGNPVETTVLTLSAQAGKGGVTLTESNGLTVDTVTVRVNRVDAAGTANAVTLAQANLVAADGGILLATTGGNLTLSDDVQAGGSGGVQLKAMDGAIIVNNAIATGSGAIGLASRATIRLGADGDLATAGGSIDVATTAGVVTMEEGATAQARGGAVRIQGLGELALGGLPGQGGLLEVKGSPGSGTIQLGGSEVPAGGSHLSTAAIAGIGEGFAQVAIGANLPGQNIVVAGSGSPVVFRDELALNAGVIHVEGTLGAEGLHANGAVEIAGGVTVNTGNGAGAGGDMVFGKNIDGAAGSVNDLTLAAGGDSITVAGTVGASRPLHSLTIRDAVNVSFNQAVTVDGNLVIHASGVVRFDGPLTLNGGTLTIDGASQVIIGDIVVHGQTGPLVLQSDTLALQGNVVGAGTVVVKTVDPSRGIEIGTGSTGSGTLNVDLATLAKLSTAAELVFGSEGASGKVTLGAIDFAAITAAPVTVHGGLVEVQAGSGVLKTGAGLLLDGRDGVLVGDDIQAGGAVAIKSGAGVTMAAGTHVSGSGRIDVVAPGEVRIGQLQADLVVVDGSTLRGNGDGNTNIVAKQVSLDGYGPLSGQAGALVIQSPSVHVAAMNGVIVQDTDPDGKSHFYLLEGGKMYEQAVALGSVERVSRDPAAVAPVQAFGFDAGVMVEPMASLLAAGSWSADWATGGATLGYLGGNTSAAAAAQPGLLSSGSLGIVQGSAGQPAAAAPDFSYWLEDLVI